MKKGRILVGTAVMLLFLCGSSFAQWRCSLYTVRGTWAYQGHGTVMMIAPGSSDPVPVPFAAVGIEKIDYQGHYSVRATISVGGAIQDLEFSGTMQVNPDCTATDAYTFNSVQGTDQLVILNNGLEMRSMPTTFPFGPAAGMFYFRRMSWGEPQCSSYMVRGSYVGPREGTQMMQLPGQPQPIPVPFSAVHKGTFQYGGNGTAASTASLGGTIVDFEFPQVSIEINADCTATMKYTGVSKQFPGQTFSGAVKYVMLNHGDELVGLDTEANPGVPAVVLDNLKRISSLPIVPNR